MARRKQRKGTGKERQETKGEKDVIGLFGFEVRSGTFFAAVLVLSVLLYVYSKHYAFGVTGLVSLLALFLRDVLPKKWGWEGLKASAVELIIAFVAALALWLALSFVLQTETPIDVVTSCSMLPGLERGDLIVLQGGEISAPEVRLEKGRTDITLLKNQCALRHRDGTQTETLCTTGMKINGEALVFKEEGDVIVYEPEQRAGGYGLIVHRAVLKLKTQNETFFITKGDNNPKTDLEGISSRPVPEKNVKGKIIARIPLIGYLKLFLALQFEEPEGCKYQVVD